MYSFQTGAGKRRQKQLIRLLLLLLFILVIALGGVTYSYLKSRNVAQSTSQSILARAVSEASEAQTAVYRLTQSSGTNTSSLLSTVRSHIYALECLNALAANIYGAGTVLTDPELLSACQSTLTECETRLQTGNVITTQTTRLRDQIDQLVQGFGGVI